MSEPTPQHGSTSPVSPGGRSLARRLGLPCAVLIAPILALEAFLLVQLSTAERTQHETAAREAARRIALVLDRKVMKTGETRANASFANAALRLLAGDVLPDPARIEDARQAMSEAADEAVRAGTIVRHLRELMSQGAR